MNRASRLILLPLCVLAACEHGQYGNLDALAPLAGNAGTAAPRIDGTVGTPNPPPPAQTSYGRTQPVALPPGSRVAATGGDITLDFADTDIRDVVAQILGSILRVNYTIDPAVHGTVTLHTAVPLSAAQVLPVLQTLLAQTGAALVQADGIYSIVPAKAAAGAAGAPAGATNLAAGNAVSGSIVMQLHYAAADDLAKVLQPFAVNGARITADAGRNALLISGDPAARAALVDLVQAFDIDILAGQSYALLPVTSGSAKDFASALQDAVRSQSGGALAGVVHIVPMERLNALLVVSSQPRYIDDVRRIFGIVERARTQTTRSWFVYYLQNSRANDMAYVLQQAFTPNDVTAQPASAGQTVPGAAMQQVGGGTTNGGMGGGIGGGSGIAGGGPNQLGGASGGLPSAPAAGGAAAGGLAAGRTGAQPGTVQATALNNPLLGGLDQSAGASTDDSMRIIPDEQNNALLIFGTRHEDDTVEAMLRKIDILPLQVRIDATIAEVDLNDQLQYGTQFFFKGGGINGILSAAQSALTNPASAAFSAGFPGFVLSGNGNTGVPFALSALQQVTKVHVLSSPQLLVLDNQPARLEVGNLVPYLSQTSQSTIASNAPVVSSINYQQTGVIMQVTPRVDSGGLVTLDISQEVSDVAAGVTTPGINSPTFEERNISSRVVVQDGQTIGLAGLIRDNTSTGNSGLPWLKDIPILGLLAGQQNNQRNRTELLVLITPHVLHDQRDARALTQDLREQLIDAASVPAQTRLLRPSGSADPGAALRRRLGLER
jgi:general secretion pathway protein D